MESYYEYRITYQGSFDGSRCSKLSISMVCVMCKEIDVHKEKAKRTNHDNRKVHGVGETALQTVHALQSCLFLDIIV